MRCFGELMSDPNPAFPHPLSPELPALRLGSRDFFEPLAFRAYLAHAAISPANQALLLATRKCAELVARQGVASFPLLAAQRERLRGSVAELLSVPKRNIALTPGCTRGIADVALGLPWEPGDRLLTFEGEFPANVSPWQFAARGHGGTVELRALPDPTKADCRQTILDDLNHALGGARSAGRSIRWVAVSAVQFQTGMRMPLGEMAEVCKRQQARLFVDGIQACGVIPLDLGQLGVDAFFTGAHKWLLGLEGAGFSYLGDDLLESLRPLTAGWLSHEDGEHFLFRGPGHLRYDRPLVTDARVFEGSTGNAIGFCALEAGVEVNRRLGPGAIFQHVQEYHDQMEPQWVARGFRSLRSVDPKLRSCILSFVPPLGIAAVSLAAALKERGVIVSIPDGVVRLAPHFANSTDEIPFVLGALDEALSEIRSAE